MDKIVVDKIVVDKFEVDKFEVDKFVVDKVVVDKVVVDEVVVDEVVVDEVVVDEVVVVVELCGEILSGVDGVEMGGEMEVGLDLLGWICGAGFVVEVGGVFCWGC